MLQSVSSALRCNTHTHTHTHTCVLQTPSVVKNTCLCLISSRVGSFAYSVNLLLSLTPQRRCCFDFLPQAEQMALTVLMCGAVPFDPAADGRTCRCYCFDFVANVDGLDLIDGGRVIRLPDVVVDSIRRHRPLKPAGVTIPPKAPLDVARTHPPPPTEEEAKNPTDWKAVGRDLRRIADHFRASSGRNQSSSARNPFYPRGWMWNLLLHSAVLYAGWRIQRWASA